MVVTQVNHAVPTAQMNVKVRDYLTDTERLLSEINEGRNRPQDDLELVIDRVETLFRILNKFVASERGNIMALLALSNMDRRIVSALDHQNDERPGAIIHYLQEAVSYGKSTLYHLKQEGPIQVEMEVAP